MNDATIFRKINSIEAKIIINSFNSISPNLSSIFDILKNKLYILINNSTAEKDFPSIYLITDEQQKMIDEISSRNRIYAAGLFLGFIKKGYFYLSIEGVEYIYKNGIYTDFKQLHLNESGEKSFLYRNNILKKMVRKSPNALKEKDFLVVLNEYDEIIGLGISRVTNVTSSNLKPNDVFAININDKGHYLRKNQ